jgi:hypothetical protein
VSSEVPLLFFLDINDIRGNLRYCRHYLFADNCQIYLTIGPGDGNVRVRLINEDVVAKDLDVLFDETLSGKVNHVVKQIFLRFRLGSEINFMSIFDIADSVF